jgi:hypothetical protein
MVYFTADTTLEVRRKTRLDDVVSQVAPGVEVQMDETWMLPERGKMTSTTGSYGNIKRYRGVHAIDYALLNGKSGNEVLQKHPHPTINSLSGREWWVSLGVSIEAGKQLECSSPHYVSYEPGCDAPYVYVRKSPTLTQMRKSWLRPLLKPKETLQKEQKTRRLQECSSSNATRMSWTNVQ